MYSSATALPSPLPAPVTIIVPSLHDIVLRLALRMCNVKCWCKGLELLNMVDSHED